MAEAGKNMLAQEDERFMSTNTAIINEIISLCILMLMIIFPLIYDDAYANIMDVKYVSYYIPVIMMLGLLLIAAVIMAIMDKKNMKEGIQRRCCLVCFLRTGRKPFWCQMLRFLCFVWLLGFRPFTQNIFLSLSGEMRGGTAGCF